MKRKLAALALIALTLTGCSAGEGANRTNTDTGWVTAQYVELPDGRSVICIMSNTKISCDWERAK